jgi:hypothetical protein
LYCVCASESYLDVRLFEMVGDFSDFMAVVCECGPFFGFVVGIVRVSFFVAYVFSVLLRGGWGKCCFSLW